MAKKQLVDETSFEACVAVVREGLEDNTAFATAVRFEAAYGHKADRLMTAAAAEQQEEEAASAPQPIELPSADKLEEDLLFNIGNTLGGKALSEETKATVKCFVALHVEHRNWLLGLIGYEVS